MGLALTASLKWKASSLPRFTGIFLKSRAINSLSAARLFLFGARDVWFVVALPVYLASNLGWDHWAVSGFLAMWIIGYGLVQAFAPKITGRRSGRRIGRLSVGIFGIHRNGIATFTNITPAPLTNIKLKLMLPDRTYLPCPLFNYSGIRAFRASGQPAFDTRF